MTPLRFMGNAKGCKDWGARPFYRAVAARRRTQSLCGASRAALPDKDVFGGTPTIAHGTHALPIHLSALIRILGSHSLANHSAALFFCPIRVHPGLSVVEFPGLRLAAPG